MLIEQNKIYNCDAFWGFTQLKNKSIDLVLVDPPYKIGYDSKNKWDNGEFVNFTELWIKECVRVLKDNGTMWSFMGYENLFIHKGCTKGFSSAN